MSNLPQQNTIFQYLADGITTVYTYPFFIPVPVGGATFDIAVYVTPSGQAPVPSQIQTQNVAYTVQNAGNLTGGTITFQTGFVPPASSVVTVARAVGISIDTNFASAQTITGSNLDAAFQRVVLICQQLQSTLTDRVIAYAINSFLPTNDPATQLVPPLADQQIWQNVNGVITAVTLTQGDLTTLQAQLLSVVPGADGTSIIGYYDPNSQAGYRLNKYLNSSNIVGNDTGSVNALAITVLNTSLTAYIKGMSVKVTVANTNTSAPTININGLGAKAIYRDSVTPAVKNDLILHRTYDLVYDGTHFLIVDSDDIPPAIKPSNYYIDTGAANAYIITVTDYSAYVAGDTFSVKIANTNTATSTINVNNVGAKTIKKMAVLGKTNLILSELIAGGIYQLVYDGTDFILQNPTAPLAYSFFLSTTTSQTSLGTGNTKVAWSTIDYTDPYGVVTYNSDTLVAGVAGLYEINAAVTFGTAGTAIAQLMVFKNGSLVKKLGNVQQDGAALWTVSGTVKLQLAANDAIGIYVTFSAGSGNATNGAATDNYFEMTYLGK